MNGPSINRTINSIVLALIVASLVWSADWLLWIAALLCAGSVAGSRCNDLVAGYWMRFSAFVGNIISIIILSVVFFFFLMPVAALYRLCDKRLVRHFKANRRESLFDTQNTTFEKKDFIRQW